MYVFGQIGNLGAGVRDPKISATGAAYFPDGIAQRIFYFEKKGYVADIPKWKSARGAVDPGAKARVMTEEDVIDLKRADRLIELAEETLRGLRDDRQHLLERARDRGAKVPFPKKEEK